MPDMTDKPTDDKGRPTVQTMTTDEKLDEILVILRAGQDAFETAAQNPMLKTMIGL